MEKMFEEFVRRAQEEERLRNQAYYQRQQQNQAYQNQFFGRGASGQEWFDNGAGYAGPNANRTGNYQKDYERAKAEERRQRAEEYERAQREQQERAQQTLRDFQDTLEKVGRSYTKGREVAEKDGLIRGVISGVKDFFKQK